MADARGKTRRTAGVAACAVIAMVSIAATDRARAACADEFLGGTPPTIPAAMARGSVMLCKERYTALASTLTRTGIWSAERLEGWAAQEGPRVPRDERFRPEASLGHAQRAETRDYAGSGLDRGHLTPAGDEPDDDSKADTFDLAQAFPQAREKNRHLWERVERATRAMAMRDGEVYVVTGTLFLGPTLRLLNGRVYVPTHVWKAVYEPARGRAGVYVTTNVEGEDWNLMDVDAFLSRTGIDPFPALRGRARTDDTGMPGP